jgi:integrase
MLGEGIVVSRRQLPPGASWITLPSGARRVELVLDIGIDPATGRRRQTRRRYATAEEALEAYTAIRTEVREGRYVARTGLTVTEVCSDWLAGRRLRAGTLANYRNSLKPLIAAYGAVPIQSLTKKQLNDLITQLQSGELLRADGRSRRSWKPKTVNLMLRVVTMMLEDALRQGLVPRNVAALVDRVPQTEPEIDTYTEDEVGAVLDAARTDQLEHAWHLALSGLRRGEVCGLRREDIDLEAMTLTVRRSRVSVDGTVIEEPPKTRSGARTLPLPQPLVEILRRAKARHAAERLAAGASYEDSGYLVTDSRGGPLHPETVSDYWDVLVISAGVRRIRLHDARHTCGTLMHLQGVPIAVIAAWLGHSNPAFTMKTYVHSQPDALLIAARSLARTTQR